MQAKLNKVTVEKDARIAELEAENAEAMEMASGLEGDGEATVRFCALLC